MGRRLKILMSIPYSVWFNFRYLTFKQAIKLPIWIATNTHVRNMWRGGIKIENIAFNSIHIGYHVADAVDCAGTRTIINIHRGGILQVNNDAHIGRGAVICVNENGYISVGENFAISGTTSIVCSKQITIGHDVQFSWNTLVMDSDAHKVYDTSGKQQPNAGAITIGNKVWIAANVTILKNSKIGNNCIIACNSLINKPIHGDDCVIGGTPAIFIKKIAKWEL